MTSRSTHPRRSGLVLVKGVVGLVILVGLTGGGWAIVRPGAEGGDLPIDVFRATQLAFEVTATGNGELRAKNQTALRSQLEQSTAIVEIVPEGSRVKKGEVLVELNSDSIQKRLDDEMLTLESARSDLISAENSYEIQISDNESALRTAKLNLVLGELDLRKWQEGELVEKRMKLKLDIERAQREHKRLKSKAERSRELYANGFLSKDELDQDELAYIEAISKLETSKLAQEVYEKFTYDQDLKLKTSHVEETLAEVDRVGRQNESELASKQAIRTNRRRQLEMRENRVAKLQEQLDNCTITAPNDGLVVYATSVGGGHWRGTEDALDVGSDIRPNQEIIILPDTSEMVAVVKIPEALLGRMRIGQRAAITIDAAQGRTFPGAVETIGVMAQTAGWRDPNVREYEVRIALDLGDAPHKLKPSMRCEARIILDDVDNALAVPVHAVFSEGRHRFVYAVEGQRYVQTPIQVGRRSDQYAEVLSGLDEGQRVLLRDPEPNRIVKADFSDEHSASGRPEYAARRGRPSGEAAKERPQRGEGARQHKRGGAAGAAQRGKRPTDGKQGPAKSGDRAQAKPAHERAEAGADSSGG